jgi:hypothetical protein
MVLYSIVLYVTWRILVMVHIKGERRQGRDTADQIQSGKTS